MTTTLNDLLGKICTSVTATEARVTFRCDDGTAYTLHHHQNCCEDVTIEDICGDLEDLVGAPILLAEESTNKDDVFSGLHGDTLLKVKFLQGSKVPVKNEYEPESFTWTFYRFRTVKGSVDIRWYGVSNGYYSESVSFEKEE